MSSNDFSQRMRGGFGKFGGRVSLLLIGLGLLCIGIGWNGVASNINLVKQMPYAVSGVGLGIAFVVVGTGLMVLQGFREERSKLEAKFDEVIFALGGRTAAAAGSGVPADLAGLVVAGSASYHKPNCRLVDGREEVEYLTAAEAQDRFLQPCRVCQPDGAKAKSRR